MPLPNVPVEQIDDIYTSTLNAKLPEIWDNVYNSNPVIGVLNERDRVVLGGGRRIEQPFIYGKLPGGSYGSADDFSTQRVNTKSEFILPWARHYVDLTIDGMDDLQNAGAAQVFDNAVMKADEAEFTLKDNLGTELFLNSLYNSGNAISGFEEWIDDGTNFTAIGGITRGTDPVGLVAKGKYDATGGAWTYALAQNMYGQCTIESRMPTIIATTQVLWDKMSVIIQPLQRYNNPSPTGQVLARIGFSSLRFGGSGAEIVVDSHCQTGRAYYIHDPAWKMIVHSARPGTKLRGWMPVPNQDKRVTQLLWAGQMICASPRLNGQQRGLTA